MADDTATSAYTAALAEYASAKAENDQLQEMMNDHARRRPDSDQRLFRARDALAAAALAKDGAAKA